MNAVSFVFGFASGLIAIAVIMAAVYGYLKQTRAAKPGIKGYLDLIPDLTEGQRNRVQEIRKVFLPKVEEIRQNMRRGRSELAGLLFEEPADRSAILKASAEIVRCQSELEQEVIEHILEEKELLSPPQRRRFFEIIVEQFSSGGLGVHDLRKRTERRPWRRHTFAFRSNPRLLLSRLPGGATTFRRARHRDPFLSSIRSPRIVLFETGAGTPTNRACRTFHRRRKPLSERFCR